MQKKWALPPLLRMDGQLLAAGSPWTFAIDDIHFTLASRKVLKRLTEEQCDEDPVPTRVFDGKEMWPNVLNLSPFITYDLTDERSAYAILLMHRVWPDGEEDNILPLSKTAVEHLDELIQRGAMLGLDKLVGPSRRIRTDLAANGTPISGGAYDRDEEDRDLHDEADDEDEFYAPRVTTDGDEEGFEFDVAVASTAPPTGESCFIELRKQASIRGRKK